MINFGATPQRTAPVDVLNMGLGDLSWLTPDGVFPSARDVVLPLGYGRWTLDSGILAWLDVDAGRLQFFETCLP